jgi:hypothetical protein
MDELLGIEARSSPPAFEEYMARVHPEDQPAMMRNLHESLAERAPVLTAEHRIVRPDGAVRWFEAKARLSYAPDGSPTELVGVVVDITERRSSEEARAAALQAQDLASRRAGAVERRLALLARAADLLDTPLDIDAALQHVADLSIGALADWCTVDLVTDGRIHHVAVAHRDAAMVARAREVKELYPQDVEEPGFRHIVTSLQPLFVREFDYRLVDETSPTRSTAGFCASSTSAPSSSSRWWRAARASGSSPWWPAMAACWIRRTSSWPSTWADVPVPPSRRPVSTPSCGRPRRCCSPACCRRRCPTSRV